MHAPQNRGKTLTKHSPAAGWRCGVGLFGTAGISWQSCCISFLFIFFYKKINELIL